MYPGVGVKDLKKKLSLYLHSYFVYVNSKGSKKQALKTGSKNESVHIL